MIIILNKKSIAAIKFLTRVRALFRVGFGDEADLAHAGFARLRHRLGHAFVAHRLVAADVQFGLRLLGGLGGEAGGQLAVVDLLARSSSRRRRP